MKIKHLFMFAAMAAALSILPLFAVDKMSFAHERKLPIYKCGEKAQLTLSAWEKDALITSGQYDVELRFCGRKPIETISIDFSKGNPAKIECTLTEPGFILLRVLDKNKTPLKINKVPVLAGAAFEPEKIRKGYETPEDFMSFWESNRKQLENVPVELKKSEKFSNDIYTAYYVSVKSVDNETISGYLTIPCKKGKFPALVVVPGAGPGYCTPLQGYAKSNVITLMVNVHKFPTADNAKEQKSRYLADAKKSSYPHRGAKSKETYFFRGVYSAIDRMINYIAARDEFDGKHLVVDGSSQGGGSALILAGLNKNVTALAANVPALCDHGGHKVGRAPGWPSLHVLSTVDKFAPYFDAANFASFITVPALLSCGFIDTTCSPSSVYAAFNELKGEKIMIHVPLEGHTVSGAFTKARQAFIHKHLGL